MSFSLASWICLLVLLQIPAFLANLPSFPPGFSYAVPISVTYNPSPIHSEESFQLNTYELVSSGKLASDCSSLALVWIHDTQNEPLPFWTETECPSQNVDSPYTTIWVDIPSEHNEDLDHSIWLLYGIPSDDDDGSTSSASIDRMVWSGSEVRMFLTPQVCPNGWEEVVGWKNPRQFLVPASSSTSHGLQRMTADHSHSITHGALNCTNVTGTPSVVRVCGEIGGIRQSIPNPHSHQGISGSPVDTDPQFNPIPPSMSVRPCIFTNNETERSIESHVLDLGQWVAISQVAVSGLLDSRWNHLAESQGRALSFGNPLGLISSGPPSHDHSVPFLSGDFHVGDVRSADGILDTGAVTDLVYNIPTHAHDVVSIHLDPSRVSNNNFSAEFVHIVSMSSSHEVAPGEENWMEPLVNIVRIFFGQIPPLGYSFIPSSGFRLLYGMEENDPTPSFENPRDEPKHKHYLSADSRTDVYNTGPNLAAMVNETCSDGVYWSGGRTTFTNSPSPGHRHSCEGETAEVGSPDLPNHVVLVLGSRRDNSQRTVEFSLDDEVVIAADSGGLGVGPTVAIAILVPLFIIIAVIAVIVIAIVVVFLAKKRKRRQGGDSVTNPTTSRSRSNDALDEIVGRDQLEEMATLDIDESLFEVDYDDLKVERSIGQGGSSATVFKATYQGITVVAFKAFKLHEFLSQEKFSEFEKEVQILASIAHPFILRFLGACLHPPRIGFIMEFCENGDVAQFVKGNKSTLDMKTRIRLLREIASAMTFLHKKSIVHRDLKSENVLVDGELHAKVMDFGLSRKLSQSNMTVRIGTSRYMAPELVLGDHYDEKVDVFSFGIMTFELITMNFQPYGDVTSVEMKVANDSLYRPRLEEEGEFDTVVVELMKECWAHQASDRPAFCDVMEKLQSVE